MRFGDKECCFCCLFVLLGFFYIFYTFLDEKMTSHNIWFSDINHKLLTFSTKLLKCSSCLYFIAVLTTKRNECTFPLKVVFIFCFQYRGTRFLLFRYALYQSPQVPVEDDGFLMLQFTAGCLRCTGISHPAFPFCGPFLGFGWQTLYFDFCLTPIFWKIRLSTLDNVGRDPGS